MKQKPCPVCNEPFTKQRIGQKACSPLCAIELAKEQRHKEAQKAHRERKKRYLDHDKAYQLKACQSAFNKFIRIRDAHLPCISCGRHHQGQYHAGHYRTTKAAPQLRFNEGNCHKQCQPCNSHLSGNITEYRINLVKKIGIARVEALENSNEVKKWTVEELREIRKYYQQKCKELEAA